MNPDTVPSSPARAASLPGARSALVLLLLINLFNYIDRQMLAAVVPQLKASFFGTSGGPAAGTALGDALLWCQQHFGFKPENALVGVLSTAFLVVYMLGAPLFGKLAERHSRWVLIGTGIILWSVASGASGLAAGFGVLLLTRCLVGVGEAAYGPVAPTIISDYFPVERRGRVLAWFYMAIPVGSALGYVIGDVVAKSNLGPWGAATFHGPAESWRWAFFVVVPPGIALGLWSLRRRELPRTAPAATTAPVRRDYGALLRTPSFVYCTLGMTAMTFAIGGIGFWMPDYLQGKPGVGSMPTTLFGAITVVAGLAGTLAGGIAGDRLRRRFPGSYFLVSGAAMFAGFPFFLAVLRAPFPFGWVLMFVAVFCLFFNTGPTNTILANVTAPSIRATAFAVNILVIHALGDVISPVVIGILADKYSMEAGFLVVGVMFLVAGVCWLLGARHLARDTHRATEEEARS
jgi:MFS family permease